MHDPLTRLINRHTLVAVATVSTLSKGHRFSGSDDINEVAVRAC